ncbi:cytoplasmic protein [Ammoniphilus oxalaticus]|uniref:Cytoplasmic protein n=1 Tax=Ammoniphilus oxalaticus TaxID=66863 RepID=A0A419SGU9_9BACL|nr:MOSC domain-containing protein [Ammoniphilus oxalaticus]RKD23009.1 cytoplasmic protein [Ammoniphilus oxalaticus]
MQSGQIISINVGKPEQVEHKGKQVSTAIYKQPVTDPLFLSKVNFDGDGQADLVHHGGVDKAVCVYPLEHYPHWEQALQTELAYGAFGENLTTRGLLETDVCIGDIFKLGAATVQISQPRQPCYKLSIRYGLPEMPLHIQQLGYTGYYLRVLEEGVVSSSDSLVKLKGHPKAITVAFANRLMHHDKNDFEGIKQVLEVEELSSSWRRTFSNRLKGDPGDSSERLTGKNNL